MAIDLGLYPVQVRRLSDEDGGGWLAEIPDFPGCMSDGDNPQAAIDSVLAAALDWIDAWEGMGRTVPVPMSEEFSGQTRVRVPKTLHRKLAMEAKREGVSLNTLMVSLLAEGIGSKHG